MHTNMTRLGIIIWIVAVTAFCIGMTTYIVTADVDSEVAPFR